MSQIKDNKTTNAEARIEAVRDVLEAAVVLRDEAAEARDRAEDLNQASYWSGRANALSELITRLKSTGI